MTIEPAHAAFDPFGRDAAFVERTAPLLDALLDRVFRLTVEGETHLPKQGPALLVANHAGAFPWDALVLSRLIPRATEGARRVRPLLEDAVMTTPFLGTFMRRVGCARASQQNALRLLDDGELVAAFPEGLLGLAKLYRHRHQLVRFGRGGFVRLALKAQVPIVPIAVSGAEDTAPLLAKIEWIFRGTAVSYLPVTPLFPLLGPLGVLPLPARWAVSILPPIDPRDHVDDIDDTSQVSSVAADIRGRIQTALETLGAVAPRDYRFWRDTSV